MIDSPVGEAWGIFSLRRCRGRKSHKRMLQINCIKTKITYLIIEGDLTDFF